MKAGGVGVEGVMGGVVGYSLWVWDSACKAVDFSGRVNCFRG